MIIYIIRHAQTVHNKKGKVFSGVSDVLLSDEGKREAEKCRELDFLNNVKKIYMSPLKRAKQTADIIFDKALPRIIIPALSEMDFGSYEGKILNEENTKDEIFRKWLKDPKGLKFPGGDDFCTHALEALCAFKSIAENESEDVIAIVSHRTTIRLILTQLLNRDINTFREIPCDNCSVSRVKYENGEFFVEEMNVTVR